MSIAQREWKKKKAQKKAQRLKQMEDEREQDKNKWLQFNTKVRLHERSPDVITTASDIQRV